MAAATRELASVSSAVAGASPPARTPVGVLGAGAVVLSVNWLQPLLPVMPPEFVSPLPVMSEPALPALPLPAVAVPVPELLPPADVEPADALLVDALPPDAPPEEEEAGDEALPLEDMPDVAGVPDAVTDEEEAPPLPAVLAPVVAEVVLPA